MLNSTEENIFLYSKFGNVEKRSRLFINTIRIFIIIVLILLWFFSSINRVQADEGQNILEPDKVLIYYSEACTGCLDYINTLRDYFIKNGYSVELKDYINRKENREELNIISDELCIPPKLQGHIVTFVEDRIILEGHVSIENIEYLENIKNDLWFEKILIFQDEMSNPKWYTIWAFKGDPVQYDINEPISTYADWFVSNKENLSDPQCDVSEEESVNLLLLVIITGFLDGLNPCAFAVLLFFIAFLFTIKKLRTSIISMGILYIISIYFTYFMIGIGLWQAFVISNVPHLMAMVGSWLVIALGAINIIGYFFPKFPIKLNITIIKKEVLSKILEKATLLTSIIAGILVGLCTFPCSGGPYIAVLGLLSSKENFFNGLGYLLLYNLMFVVPLIIILIIASNPKLNEKLIVIQQKSKKVLKLFSGIIMILLGAIILLFFI